MDHNLTPEGYIQTKEKLDGLRVRLEEIRGRTDLEDRHRGQVERSYERTIRQYLEEIRLYEAARPARA